MGYAPYPEVRRVPLTVEGEYANLIGRTAAFIGVKGHVLPEEETMGGY